MKEKEGDSNDIFTLQQVQQFLKYHLHHTNHCKVKVKENSKKKEKEEVIPRNEVIEMKEVK